MASAQRELLAEEWRRDLGRSAPNRYPGRIAPRPFTFWCVHDDGRHLQVTGEVGPRTGVGVHVGSDPRNDVVLEGLEAFHVLVQLNERHEIITGSAQHAGRTLVAGHIAHGFPLQVGPWSLAAEPAPERNGTILVWRDAVLEGRDDIAAALLAEHGIVLHLGRPKGAMPRPLLEASRRRLVRVEAAGRSQVHDLGTWSSRGSLTVAGQPGLLVELVVPEAQAASVSIYTGRKRLHGVCELRAAGSVQILLEDRVVPLDPELKHPLPHRWVRLRLGDAVIQLCRYPGRGERDS